MRRCMVGQRGWRRSCSASRLHSRLDRPKCKSVVKDTHDACFIPSLLRVLQTDLWIGPKARRFSLPLKRHFNCHSFPPAAISLDTDRRHRKGAAVYRPVSLPGLLGQREPLGASSFSGLKMPQKPPNTKETSRMS